MGPTTLAGELLGRVQAELPVVGGLGGAGAGPGVDVANRAAIGAHRRAHAGDVGAWLGWLAGRGPMRWRPGRVYVDL